MNTVSAFAKYEHMVWKYRFHGRIHVGRIAGGTPTDPRVIEGWIRTKLGAESADVLAQQVAETAAERGISLSDAQREVEANRHLNGFKRDASGLYIEGRQLKAAFKEAASIAAAAGRVPLKSWGKTNKGLLGFISEHVQITNDRLYLTVDGEPVHEATGVAQRFVHTFRGAGIQYEEYVDDAEFDFEVIADYKFDDEHWPQVWLTGEQEGIGAARSQGYGRYTVVEWEAA